jgi:hypothetical protein
MTCNIKRTEHVRPCSFCQLAILAAARLDVDVAGVTADSSRGEIPT